MRRKMLFLSLCFALAAQSLNAHAQQAPEADEQAEEQAGQQAELPPASLSRSERQEQALRRQLPAGELRQLESGDEVFLGLFLAAARPEPRGGVLLIADRDEHADWPVLIGPARRQLSHQGWHTLAITLPATPLVDPTIDQDARAQLLADAAERTTRRINVAAQALQAEGADNLVLLGRGEGAFWALHATADDTQPRVEAAGLILAQARSPERIEAEGVKDRKIVALLNEWDRPVYDIFIGGEDAVRERAEHRKLSAQRQGNREYRQLLLPDPDQSELGQRVLIKRLQGWLEKNIPSE